MLRVLMNIALTWILISLMGTAVWILLVYFMPKRPRKMPTDESADALHASGRQLTLPY